MVPLRESGGAERTGALFCGSHMLQGWFHARNIVLPTRGTGHFARRLRTWCSGVRSSLSG